MFFRKPKKQEKAFVSIGTGVNQVPLIREAKSKGFRVIGVDMNSMTPGFRLCDLKIQESIYDYDSIYTLLSEALFDSSIGGIMTRSYGGAVTTTAFLCEKFGLPFMPFSVCENFTDKLCMKNMMLSHGINTPELVSGARLNKPKDKYFFPIIKKPVDGYAKKGIKLINNLSQFKEETSSSDSKKAFIFEKYIEGDEIIAMGIIHNGYYYLVDITDKIRSADPPFIDISHTTPSKYAGLGGQVIQIGQSITKACSIVNSPLLMEFIVDKEETLYLIEALPEFGGEFLADIAIPKATGYNFIREAINAHTGSEFKPPVPRNKRKAVAVHYVIVPEGKLESFDNNAPLRIKGVFYFSIFQKTGYRINKLSSNLDRIGVVVAEDETVEKALKAARAGADAANIQVVA